MGRPAGAQNKDKPFRDALRMELAAAGDDHKALREVAKSLIAAAQAGDMQAIKELADRIDGKVAQPVSGSDDDPPINLLQQIEYVVTYPDRREATD